MRATKETILAAIDRADCEYLQAHCNTKKNTVNKRFAHTSDTIATVTKNEAGKQRVVAAAMVLARAI